MRMTGVPLSNTSSMSEMPNPVLPDPVWPTMTAWVVSEAGSTVIGVPVR